MLLNLVATYGSNDWKEVEFMLSGPENTLLYSLAPTPEMSTLTTNLQIIKNGIYSIAVDFPSDNHAVPVNVTDLKCSV